MELEITLAAVLGLVFGAVLPGVVVRGVPDRIDLTLYGYKIGGKGSYRPLQTERVSVIADARKGVNLSMSASPTIDLLLSETPSFLCRQ